MWSLFWGNVAPTPPPPPTPPAPQAVEEAALEAIPEAVPVFIQEATPLVAQLISREQPGAPLPLTTGTEGTDYFTTRVAVAAHFKLRRPEEVGLTRIATTVDGGWTVMWYPLQAQLQQEFLIMSYRNGHFYSSFPSSAPLPPDMTWPYPPQEPGFLPPQPVPMVVNGGVSSSSKRQRRAPKNRDL